MATKSSSSRRKSGTVARRVSAAATKTSHRSPTGKTRRGAAPRRSRAKPNGKASDNNPPLSPEVRATLTQLSKRGKKLVSRLSASIAPKKKRSAKAK